MNTSLSRINPVARAVMVIGAVAALVTGITFAALSSTATLTDNSIASATASLKLWDGDSFESEAPGFTVTGLVPGQGKEFSFYFKNEGDVALDVTAAVPAIPTLTGITGGASKVLVTFSSDTCADAPVVTNLQALWTNPVELPCNPLDAGAQGNNAVGAEATEGNYKVKFDIDPTAVTGGSANVANFDLVFTGTAAAPAPAETTL